MSELRTIQGEQSDDRNTFEDHLGVNGVEEEKEQLSQMPDQTSGTLVNESHPENGHIYEQRAQLPKESENTGELILR